MTSSPPVEPPYAAPPPASSGAATARTYDGIDSADVEGAWATVEARWEDAAAHARFVALCQATRRLDRAAALYRAAGRDAARAPEAERRLNAIIALVMAELATLRAPRPDLDRRRAIGWAVLFAVGALAVALYLLST